MPEPTILAEFQLDAEGCPIVLSRDRKHFALRIFVKGAPTGTRSITYQLHETFLRPQRVVPRTVPRFEEELTSYGDFEITALVSGGDGKEPAVCRQWLSAALRSNYGQQPDEEIDRAIKAIKDN